MQQGGPAPSAAASPPAPGMAAGGLRSPWRLCCGGRLGRGDVAPGDVVGRTRTQNPGSGPEGVRGWHLLRLVGTYHPHMGLAGGLLRRGRRLGGRMLGHQPAHGLQGAMVGRDGAPISQPESRHCCDAAHGNEDDRHEAGLSSY